MSALRQSIHFETCAAGQQEVSRANRVDTPGKGGCQKKNIPDAGYGRPVCKKSAFLNT
jgi:hypothetical protein